MCGAVGKGAVDRVVTLRLEAAAFLPAASFDLRAPDRATACAWAGVLAARRANQLSAAAYDAPAGFDDGGGADGAVRCGARRALAGGGLAAGGGRGGGPGAGRRRHPAVRGRAGRPRRGVGAAAGAAVDLVMDGGATSLFKAAQNGHDAVVARLLAVGTAVDKVNYNGASTPLGMASMNGHAAVVELLLAAGADVAHKGMWNPPLLWAVSKGRARAAEFLRAVGAR